MSTATMKRTYVCLYAKCLTLHRKEKKVRLLMTDKSLRNFSVFVSVIVKHLTRSDGINHLLINEY